MGAVHEPRHRVRGAALLAAAAVSLAACGETTYEQIAASPEAKLYFPGSQVLSKSGADESSGIDSGRSAAYAQVQLTSDKAMDQIYAWYNKRLLADGWQLRKVQTANGNYYLFTKGDRQLFYVRSNGTSGSSTRYSIEYGLLPAPCATTPPPLTLANC